jgi:predicted AlkP superfamily pyrophosphatase or phosphodiesterase
MRLKNIAQLGDQVHERSYSCRLATIFLSIVGAATALYSQAPAKRVILISIDGMTPAEYMEPDAHHLSIPNLRAMREGGCASPGVLNVFPASTYPNHTSMITGQPPAIHGITTNVPLDPFNLENGGWYYFAEKIRSPTVWQALRDAHVPTSAVSWPVTVGAPVDFLLPEYRPVRTPEDVALMHQLSTPGLFQEAEAADKGVDRPMSDAWRIAAVKEILAVHHPAFLALHISDLDEEQHRYGPHTSETHAELEKIDAEIGELRQFVDTQGQATDTAWLIVSDHGFLPLSKQFNPMVALREAGLITTDAAGKVTAWKVFVNNLTGSAFLVVKDKNDQASIAKATDLMNKLALDPANGIAKVNTPADLAAMGAVPEAFLGLEAAKGFGFGASIVGPALGTPGKGAHGYNPTLPEMHSSLILYGAGVRKCSSLPDAKIIDVGPTVAALLGVTMANTQGRDLNQPAKR